MPKSVFVFLSAIPPLLVGCDSPSSTSGGDHDGADTTIQPDSTPDIPATSPLLQVILNDVPVSEDGSVTVFESYDGDQRSVASIALANVGAGTIRILGVAIASTPVGALRLEPQSSSALPSPISPAELTPASPQLRLSVVFDPPATGSDVRAAISLSFEDAESGATNTFTFHLLLSAATPTIEIDPRSLDFGLVASGQAVERPISILNLGDAPLEVSGFSLAGHPGFALSVRGERWTSSDVTASGIQFLEPLVVAPAHSESVTVYFEASGSEAARATLIFGSNDADAENAVIELMANQSEAPCISVSSQDVTFPLTTMGLTNELSVVITACGDLRVSSIALLPGTSMAFSVLAEGLGAFPISLAPSATLEVPIVFAPTSIGSHTGTLRIESNAFISELDIDLSGTSSNQ